jgi:hypothetical protein
VLKLADPNQRGKGRLNEAEERRRLRTWKNASKEPGR